MEKKSLLKKITGSREASLVIVLIVLCALISIKSPAFLSAQNILEILKNNAVIMIMTLGMLCVLLIGGIDISITSTLALAGMSIGMMYKYDIIASTPLGFLIAAGMGALCGLVIGLIISYHCNHGLYVCIPRACLSGGSGPVGGSRRSGKL